MARKRNPLAFLDKSQSRGLCEIRSPERRIEEAVRGRYVHHLIWGTLGTGHDQMVYRIVRGANFVERAAV
jgi:hypothetical protein